MTPCKTFWSSRLGVGRRANNPALEKKDVTETNTRETTYGNGEEARQETGPMKDVSQTQRGAGTPMVDSLKPKQTTRIACWNVRTLYQTGKLAQVVREFDNYKLDILGISEARWTQSGRRKLASGHTIIYSGRDDNNHTEGVALLLSDKMDKCLIEWKPHGPRLLQARFNSRYTKLSIIVCYAPTEEAEEEDKDSFYDRLQAITENIKSHDMLIVLGDLNARVGVENEGRERVIGKNGYGIINDNGERLCSFCEENDLVVGGSLFPHKDIHKTTWNSPNGVTKSQIDHILINGRWRSSLKDVKVYRGADIASDHSLVIAKVRLKLRKNRKQNERGRQFDTNKLKNADTKQAFQHELKNRFEVLANDQEMNIDIFNQAFRETSEKVIGFKKKKKEEWISSETWERIDERKGIKQKINSTRSERIKAQLKQLYSEKDKEVKRSAKQDKNNYVEQLAAEAEDAAAKQDLKTLYRITKNLKGTFSNNDMPVKDSEGNLLASELERLERWKQHFDTILNRPEPLERAEIPEAEVDIVIDTGPPSLQEVKTAIKCMKSGKAPGADGITAEMLKVDEEETPRLLTEIFNQIWESEEIPETWKIGLIVKLPKKGDLTNCNNWRGITLLSLTSKVFSKIIQDRLNKAMDSHIREEQAGFRPGRSCSDQIFVLRQILEQSKEWNTPLYVNFLDLEKAFDSIHRESLWMILRHHGIPQKLVNVIKMLYHDFSSQVICNTELTDAFKISTGVKQGCILSPFLFVLGIDWIMKETISNEKRGIRWTLTTTLEDLDFADDIALLSQKQQDIQNKTTRFSNTAAKIGLKASTKKTKHMRMNSRIDTPVRMQEEDIEEVTEFTYLGSKMSADGDTEVEIRTRITKASQAFASLKNIWKCRNISTNTKIRLFKSNVLSVLLYGSESWKTTKTIENKLEVFQNRCLRRILKIFWPNTISNNDLHARTNCTPIAQQVRQRRWRYIGHTLRKQRTALPRIALRWTPDGKRKRGRPKETWRRTVEKEMKNNGWTWGFLERCSGDRPRWRSLVAALCDDHEED